jgi:short-subunit dehydrogenase
MEKGHENAKGKLVVITGASSGAGRAIAIEFAKHGARLVLAARRQQALDEVAAECEELGSTAHVVLTDTREAQSVLNLAKAAFEFGECIDIWINNAGVLAAGTLEDIPAEVNEAVIRTNLLGYIHGAHAVLPYFKQQGYGMLMNNISVGGWFATPYMAAYSASKFGLRGFFESLKGELNQYPNIHICDLYPGFLDTPGMQHAANYTGKSLKPAPPVYDPRKLAKAIISLVNNPRSKTTIGAASGFLRIAYYFFPTLSRNLTATAIRTYLKQAHPIENTSGNVLQCVEYGNGIDGGWRNTLPPSPLTKKLLLLAGLAIGFMVLSKR